MVVTLDIQSGCVFIRIYCYNFYKICLSQIHRDVQTQNLRVMLTVGESELRLDSLDGVCVSDGFC